MFEPIPGPKTMLSNIGYSNIPVKPCLVPHMRGTARFKRKNTRTRGYHENLVRTTFKLTIKENSMS